MTVKMIAYDYATEKDLETAKRMVSNQVEDDTLVVYLIDPNAKKYPTVFAKSEQRYPYSVQMIDDLRAAELIF